ncbi:hypothetical protein SDC9_170002 [bioreactor metagenome]|uniref:Uncharacterized protein n=1 Tax=bioreactor metagenome TaxID=1076179 RepID=A0A645G9Z0_9ZZZZ
MFGFRPFVQRVVNFSGQFRADAGDLVGNRLRRGPAKRAERTERPEQLPLAGGADARNLVQHRLFDQLVAQFAVETDGEPVRLVAQRLKHAQRRVMAVEHHRFAPSRQVDLFVPLRQSDDRQRRAADLHQRVHCGGELPLAAVHHHQVGQRAFLFDQPPEMAGQHLVHHREVVALVDGADLEAAIVVTVRLAVAEGDEAGDGELAEDV